MEKLKQANLYNSELIPISGKLVERYNKCLVQLGFVETKLLQFNIDARGWSPEISEEKNNLNYLNNGDANPHGIIISPLQYGKPVYVPFHSFDNDIMQYLYRTHGEKIKNITRDAAICIDFDQKIDTFYEPLDVLKYDKITIRCRVTDNLAQIQQEQFALIDTFKWENNFIDEKIHAQLLHSAKTYGDLRYRNFNLHSIQYQTQSFYTQAFNGVFVLRDFIKEIIVFEDLKWYKEAIKNTTFDVLIYHISQPELMEKLRNHLIVECNLETVVNTPRYTRIKKQEFAKALHAPKHPIQDILENKVLFKSYLNKMDIESRKRIMCVERYLEKLEQSNQYKISDIIDTKFFEALHAPHSSLNPNNQDLIWRLLVSISPKDVLFLYWYDKVQFYKQYATWDESFKDWVIQTIKNNI